jgi:hypothetical protein
MNGVNSTDVKEGRMTTMHRLPEPNQCPVTKTWEALPSQTLLPMKQMMSEMSDTCHASKTKLKPHLQI